MKINNQGGVKHYFFIGVFMIGISTMTLLYLYSHPSPRDKFAIGIDTDGNVIETSDGMGSAPARLTDNTIGYYDDKAAKVNSMWPGSKNAGSVAPGNPVSDPPLSPVRTDATLAATVY